MVKFYLLNLLNTLLFEARPLLEYLPYEEGIKTHNSKRVEYRRLLEYLPYEEGIKTTRAFPCFRVRRLEYLPYEEGIKTANTNSLVKRVMVGVPTL
ncbi:MAG: hypothetical protein D3910_18970 [Candidatus Electrothrix sp. ATG2]|nr:hypothetical protein [Candidatus Electrothrix sp. ATG2]